MNKIITYIGERPAANNHAGNKARLDINTVLQETYGTPIEVQEEIVFSSFIQKVKFVLNISNLKAIWHISQMQSKNIILQYPFYFNPIVKRAQMRMMKKNKVIFLIHDVDALRNFQEARIEEEINELNLAQAVIVHNDIMGKALQKLGLKVPWFSLTLFDYLLPNIPQKVFSKGTVIAFAGNLGKSKFLRNAEMETLGLHFNLYGPGFKEEVIKWNNVSYKGSFPPDEVPFKLEGNFGLIWDGTDVRTCDGPTGTYMKYNNPHKLSLYIAAGLPVIVWKQAAVAEFVTTHKIGIVVESLKEISEKFKALPVSEYHEMIMAVKKLQKQIVSGNFTKRCLEAVEKQIFNS